MHEEVEQGTKQNKHEGEKPKQVRSMLGDEKKTHDDYKCAEGNDKSVPRRPRTGNCRPSHALCPTASWV